ncbi:MAG: 4Fe-4S dicluster domain-containing protein [Candidatus Thorarchaeota archaeon]|nr:MAG: 4Fe-4S dicluster domain-containing protein [Candidatus Thorarchaeota archaeon]
MTSFLSIDLAKCTGCRNCELACSVRHTGTFTPSRSRIQILKDETQNIIIPMVCLQCEEPLCVDACPTGAVDYDDKGTLTVNEDDCIGCLNCVTACVYGGIELDTVTRKAVKCDLCGGDPACVPACEYGVIQLSREREGFRTRHEGMKVLSSRFGLIEGEVE